MNYFFLFSYGIIGVELSMRSKFYFHSDIRKPFIKKYLPVLIMYCFFKRINCTKCTILNQQEIRLEKKTFKTSFKFQLLNTHTYEKIVALPVFCCNGMGNVPLWRGLWRVGHTAFSIQKISNYFALILRSEDMHFYDKADTVCFACISSFLPPKARASYRINFSRSE